MFYTFLFFSARKAYSLSVLTCNPLLAIKSATPFPSLTFVSAEKGKKLLERILFYNLWVAFAKREDE